MLINNKPAARVGDDINCGGSISMGSNDVIIGDTPYQSEADSPSKGVAQLKDSGWSVATDEQLKSLGLSMEDLTIKDTNFRAQVYMPDPDVFGLNAKPVLVFTPN